MPSSTRQVVWLAALSFASLGLFACDKDDFQGAQAEVSKTAIKLDLPAVPEFDMPSANADGTNPPRYMRLRGRTLLDTEVKVKGYVLWIYDCVEHLREPGEDDREVRKRIDEDPTRCWRPHYILGDTPNTDPERGIWVVDVPRELREDEKRGLTREDLAQVPPVPQFAVGDELVVEGKWAQRSPRGFAKTEGLLVYQSQENLTQATAE
jgi:hypothetical protein